MKHTLTHPDTAERSREEMCGYLGDGFGPADQAAIGAALDLALDARDRDVLKRPRGIDAAHVVRALRVDALTVQVALLSDPYLRDNHDHAKIEARFGSVCAGLVQKVNWLNTFDEYRPEETKEPQQAELLRRMLLAVVNDVRAVLVKLAYRLLRLRLFKGNDDPLSRKVALETLDIFAPLANRLGVGQLKWELEDLAFRYLEPDTYKQLARSLATNRAAREKFVDGFIDELEELLIAQHIEARVFGRPKHIYSIFRKIERKQIPLEELYDLHAVRVIVKDVTTCYSVLGLVHATWLHIPKEFDDYIANPKENGYQSLHTVVVGAEGRPVEIQIRTEEMHAFAEYGVAAHWRYKEGRQRDAALDQSINALRRLLESKEDDGTILENFRTELFEDQIFVLTPKGQVIRLRKGATPVDFAYAIHTEVGHRCRGAKINGRIVPLTYTLKSGEKIEILTTKAGGPSLGWLDPHLGYVRTGHARGKIRAWFKQLDHDRHRRAGQAILERERHKLGAREVDLDELARQFRLPRGDDLLLAIGRADISPTQLANVLRVPDWNPGHVVQAPPRRQPADKAAPDEVTIQGVRNLLHHIARCCEPQPGEPIIGYVTLGRGVAVHRQDCRNILQMPAARRSRLIDVDWGRESEAFPVEIEVRALDRKGLLKDITHILAAQQMNIIRTDSLTDPEDQMVTMRITAEIHNLGELSLVLDQIEQVNNVLDARRRGLSER